MFLTSLCIFRSDGKIAHKDSDEDKKAYVFPDLSMDFDYGGMPTQHLLMCEIKPPHKIRTGSRPDFVKLANQMKNTIDTNIIEQ